ncbi:MAG: outer membrane protein insertion porin family [Alphaproteobacteria bacterium]|jgi:outer membrane protein insertion porin family|nr:outer membrane protein insertion porin family [Alphaproteobacteria bacterium]
MTFGVRLVRGLSVVGFVLGGIVLGALPAVVPGGVAYAQSVSSIVVEGNRRVEASTVRSYFKPSRDGRLGPHEIDEAYKALYATGLFLEVRISTVGGRVVVVVMENPVINRIAFEGNSRVKDEQIKLEIQSKERGTLSRPVVQTDVQRIVEVYRRSGRYDVRVDPKIIELPNNRVDLVFEITEGDKTTVRYIEFVGNRAYSDYRLKDVIKTSETGILAFLQTANIYDPDRLEADRELLRRFYLKHGYVDVRIVTAAAAYDPARRGFVVNFMIDEGEQYRVGTVDVRSNVRTLDPGLLRSRLRVYPGEVYNTEAVEKTVEDMTIEGARQGNAFISVRPRADRDVQARRVNIAFTIDDGQRVYIEQINVRGNTRTRDHVIRREFDVAEGDPYNRALITRAERRLKNLGYFKDVKLTTEPGSAPDRVVIVVSVEEQSTGEFSVAGGYSTSDGIMGEVSIGERNLLGLGLYAKASLQYGQHASGYSLSFVEPYLLGYRLAWGVDIFSRTQKSTNFTSYDTKTVGASTRLGFALREDLGLQLRYSIYNQKVSLPSYLMNCNNLTPNSGAGTFPTDVNGINPATGLPWIDPTTGLPFAHNCYFDGEASLAVRKELARGPVLTSLVGYDLNYNTLDNNRNPTSGIAAGFKQDFAGVGGDVKFFRTTGDFRSYYEVVQDIVGVLHLQAGHIGGWGGSSVRMLDHFQMGPNLVRGFAPSGIGPRDVTPGTTQDSLGGSMYWGASVEFQTPLYFLPKDSGVKVAAYADAGSLWNYVGPKDWTTGPGATGESLTVAGNSMFVNSSVGVGLLWASPFGPLRFDLAYPITKQASDRKQYFRFGGGATF